MNFVYLLVNYVITRQLVLLSKIYFKIKHSNLETAKK